MPYVLGNVSDALFLEFHGRIYGSRQEQRVVIIDLHSGPRTKWYSNVHHCSGILLMSQSLGCVLGMHYAFPYCIYRVDLG